MEKVSFREINRIAIPAVFAGIVEPLISLTDVAVAGNLHTHSEQALAAVGIVGSLLSTMLWVLASTKTSTSALVAKYLGMGKLKSIESLIPQAMAFNILISLILVIVANLFSTLIFEGFFLSKGITLDYCIEYFEIRSIGFPLTLVTFTIFGTFRGMQNTYWAMVISIIGGLLNAVLDILFAFQLDLGVIGIAYASVIAQGGMLILSLIYFFRKTDFHLRFSLPLHTEIKTWMFISANLFIRTILLNFTIILANRYASDYGDSYVAAQAILINIWLFSAFLIDGYSNAGSAISGRLLGEKNYRNIWILGLDLIKYSMVIALLLAFTYSVFYDQIGLIFTKEKEVLDHFSVVFWMVIIAVQPLNALAFTLDCMYKGMGKAKTLRNLLIVATFIGFVPVLLLTDHLEWKLKGIWVAFNVWMAIRSLGLFAIFRHNFSRYGR